MSHDGAYIADILEAAKLIQDYLRGIDRSTFDNDILRQDGVIRRFQIIGEAARRLSAKFKSSQPQVPWTQITAMRNAVIHQYDDVDLDQVWNTVQNDLPILIYELEHVVPLDTDDVQGA